MTTQHHGTRLPAFHRTWWKAPFAASVLGLPVLAMEYSVVRDHDGMGEYGGLIYSALALFALSWALPHRRALRTLRVLAAGAAVGITVLPVALLGLLSLMLAA
ncbi:hypothetical protein OG352_26135 [Streptomyces sp. NBC_01485]|uniref:hypothetical protein n=1 Tax=Streptomyces sp. NBC_01485 TaxID=2903884 RepID=UPI002E2F35ED|nr:hypothetical protein [Streptomyces sp. NBC_01485]